MKFRIPYSEIGLIIARYKKQGYQVVSILHPTSNSTQYKMSHPTAVSIVITFTSNGWCEVL